MGLISIIRGVIDKMFRKDVKKIFGIEPLYSLQMDVAINTWSNIVSGNPPWLDSDDDIDTINFAKFISSDTAKKICLDIDINVTGSSRADYISDVITQLKKILRDKVEDACCYGGIMFKCNGSSTSACIDYITPGNFMPTHTDSNGNILGCVFWDTIQNGNTYYHRLEYHRFEDDIYVISNRVYKSKSKDTLDREISFDDVSEWKDIQPDVYIENLTAPLFAYYKMPYNNTIDTSSPLGVSVFSNAIKELRDLDIAWSRKSGEIQDSKHMTIVSPSAVQFANKKNQTIPRFIKALDIGDVKEGPVHEHTATLLTDARINDINSILAMISTKCGFSQGEFKLDPRTGMVTATQVEADDRETIETIKEMRDALKDTIEQLIYVIDQYCSLYGYAPFGLYETSYSFGDLTYNYEEDRARHWQYVQQGKYPLWRYYVNFEGMSEEEAKEIVAEANNEAAEKSKSLFDEE